MQSNGFAFTYLVVRNFFYSGNCFQEIGILLINILEFAILKHFLNEILNAVDFP